MNATAVQRLQEMARREMARAAASPAPPVVAEEAVRIAEALIFAAPHPITEQELARRLPAGADVSAILDNIRRTYSGRGIHLARAAGGYLFRTAGDLAYALSGEAAPPQKLSRAALEVLAIIAYHQPTTRAEIEEIRGVATSKGTLDILIETGWVRLRGRRRTPGRPVTFGTTQAFLAQFGLDQIGDLPGLEELRGMGFLEGRVPADMGIPLPSDALALTPDEEPLEAEMLSMTPYGAEED